MNHSEFVFWLDGYLTGVDNLNNEQVKVIRSKLDVLLHKPPAGPTFLQPGDYYRIVRNGQTSFEPASSAPPGCHPTEYVQGPGESFDR